MHAGNHWGVPCTIPQSGVKKSKIYARAHANRWHAHSGRSLKPVLVTPAFLPCRRRLLVMVSNSLMSMVLSSLESNISKIILTSCRAQSWCYYCWWHVQCKHSHGHPCIVQSKPMALSLMQSYSSKTVLTPC